MTAREVKKHYKVGKWYADFFYIKRKYIIAGKTHYDVMDKYGEYFICDNRNLTERINDIINTHKEEGK